MKKPTRGKKTKKQHKIKLPFAWPSDVPSIVYIGFTPDFDRMEEEGFEDPSDLLWFFLDLASGEIILVNEEIFRGGGYRSPWPEQSFQIIGRGWWYGYNADIPKEFFNAPNPAVKELLGRENFNKIVDSVLEYCTADKVKDLYSKENFTDENFNAAKKKYIGDTDIVNWHEE